MFHAQVEEQTYRGKQFGERSIAWKASNGLILSSANVPDWRSDIGTLYVRGEDISDDFRVVTLTPIELKRVEEAVDEYNSTFADGTTILKVKTEKIGADIVVNLEKTHSYTIRYDDVNISVSSKGVLASRNGRTIMAV